MPDHNIDPASLTSAVEQLVLDPKYAPVGATTQCSLFVADLASNYFGNNELNGLVANSIVDFLKQAADWIPLYDPDKGVGDLTQGFSDAQNYANRGYLVLAAWPNPGDHGHVAACVPGQTTASGKWGMQVPIIAQAGQTVFAHDLLSQGFGPDKKNGIIVYFWQ